MGAEPTLYEGDLSVEGWVETLQLALRAAGQDPGPIDDKFGWRTAAAVVAFQEAHGFDKHDGVVGNETWSVLMGRDQEPPGVNNPPHGGYNPPHSASSGTISGAGSMPEPAKLEFTSVPTFDSNTISVDLDVQSTGNLVVTIWAELVQNNMQLEQSQGVTVNSNGPQRIPFQHSYPPGVYELIVHATDNAGTTIDTTATALLN